MTLSEYKTKYEPDLEEIWNDSARFQYTNYNAFVKAMYRARKLIDEDEL